MFYGPVAPKGLPEQDPELLMLLAERYQRYSAAHDKWALPAKQCVDFVEGRQWHERALAMMARDDRPALKFNKIGRLVRLVLGYMRNNRTDIRYLPGTDGTGDEDVAEILSRIVKQISVVNELPYVDAETFMDGIITGRGYQDIRLDFSENDLGEARLAAVDPFLVKIDPDHEHYDLNKAGGICVERWASVDEITGLYGAAAGDLVTPLAKGSSPVGPILSSYSVGGDITPVRSFGLDEDGWPDWWVRYATLLGEFVDPLRRSLRVLDFQYWVTRRKRVFIDLETGDRSVIPDDWDADKIKKCLFHAQQLHAAMGQPSPLRTEVRPVKSVRWTTIVGDLMVYNADSPYDTFSLIGYFPWFRRGYTQGMVDDLIDPQREINKRRSARTEHVMRQSGSGWKYHESALDSEQEARLKRAGAKPGFNLKWQGEHAPEKIEPSPENTALHSLEKDADADLNEISGINESALGEIDKVQSGRAIEARQRQAVISVQVYMDNWSRTKRYQGGKLLNIIQKHYTEPRIIRIMGEDGEFTIAQINKEHQDPSSGLNKLYDVTLGKYLAIIDEIPLASSHANAQFEEAMSLVERGIFPAAIIADILVDLSSMPRKQEIKDRLQQLEQAQAGAAGGGAPPGPGGGVPAPAPAAEPSLTSATTAGGKVVPLNPIGKSIAR